MKCEACRRGDHGNCGMQVWCDCDDERDGDYYAYPDYPIDDFDESEPSKAES